jgi:hypothetical protein
MKVPLPWTFVFYGWPRLFRVLKAIDLFFNAKQTFCRTCMRWGHGDVCPHCDRSGPR